MSAERGRESAGVSSGRLRLHAVRARGSARDPAVEREVADNRSMPEREIARTNECLRGAAHPRFAARFASLS
jgi:hypothetical protein